MEQAILIGCAVAPAATSLVFLVLAAFVARKQSVWSDPAAAVIVSIGWCAAVFTTLLIRQDLDWSALEAWQIVLAPITLSAVGWALMIALAKRGSEFRWVVASMGCLITAMIAMPSGDSWSDMLPLHRGWMAAIAGASLLNVWMLNRMIHRGASQWVLLVCLAGLAGPTMLAASAYGGLAEWLLGAIVTTLVFTVAVKIIGAIQPQWIIVPVTLFAACATASGRFYTYDDNSHWLYGVILLTPSLVAVLDGWVSNWSTAKRIAMAGIFATVLLSGIGWYLFGETLFSDPVTATRSVSRLLCHRTG